MYAIVEAGHGRSSIVCDQPCAWVQPTQSLAKLMVPPRMESAMASSYNSSQMAAVTAGLAGSQVVLIQGPPGEIGGDSF